MPRVGQPQTSRHGHLALCSATHLPLRTGKGTKRLLSQAGSDPRKLVPAGALIILLDTPPVNQHGAFSLCLYVPLLGVGWAGIDPHWYGSQG